MAQVRTVLDPCASIRESAVLPYSSTLPALVQTLNQAGPLPAPPYETILENPSFSERYSVPSPPYAPALLTIRRWPSRQKRSFALSCTAPSTPPSWFGVCAQCAMLDNPLS